MNTPRRIIALLFPVVVALLTWRLCERPVLYCLPWYGLLCCFCSIGYLLERVGPIAFVGVWIGLVSMGLYVLTEPPKSRIALDFSLTWFNIFVLLMSINLFHQQSVQTTKCF